ncbi:hypothetical protein [uncultured Bacteroides sp.]|uniref:hypothetical protein n=1 Tax=uncultured Bacteroides sp. TaxID=162156 RepID=UPI0026138590|nr:hypothetical protein [uncultured Bacteroides sp.]
MRNGILTFICLLLLLVGCAEHSRTNEDFIIRVGCNASERSGKNYIKCWINDSLWFKGTYVNKFNDETLEHFEECYGMPVATFDKTNIDSIKVKIRVISLDTLHYMGKQVIDTTFLYRIDNIPEVVVSCHPLGGFKLWDNLRTPDYFEYEY